MVVLKRFVLWENVARAKGDGPDGGAGNTPPEGTPTQKRNVQKSPQKLKQEELQKQRQEKAQDVGGDDFSTVIGGDGYSTVIGDGDAGDRGSTIQRGSTVLNDEPEKEAKSSIFNALERTKLGDGGFGGTNLLDYDKDFAAGCRDRVIKAHELYELSLSILMNHGMASESEIKDFALESDVYRLCEYASAFKSENREKLCKSFNELLGINIKPDEIKGASAIVLNAIELRDQTLSKFLENLKKHMGEADYPFADFKYRETNVVSGVDFAKVGQLIVKVENAPRPGFVKAEEGGGRAHKGQQAAWGQLKSGTETLSNPGDKKLLELTLKIENLAIEKVNATNGAIPGVKLQDENDKDQASELLKRINESKGVERLHALVDFANSAIPHTIETSSLKQSKQEEEKKKEEFVADPDVVKFCDYMGGNKTTIEQKVQLCEAIKAVLGIDVAPEQLNTDGTKDALTKAIQLKNYGVGGFLNDVKGSPSITNQNFIENFERSMMPETIANIFATLKPESPSKQKAAAEQSALSILSEAVDYFNVISSKEVAVSVEKKKGITPQSSPLSEKRRTHSSGDLLPKPNKLTPEINPDAGKDKTGRFMFGKKRGKSYSLSTTQKNQLNRPGRTGDMVGDRTPTMKVLGNLPAWEEKTKAALKKHDQNIEELGVILRNAGFSSTERKQVLDVYRHDDFATQCAALVTKLKIFKSNDQIKVIAERIKKIIESKEPNLLSNKEKIDAISSAYEELKGQFARETEVVRGYAENLITMSVKLKSALEEEKAAGENKDTAVKQGDKKLIELAGKRLLAAEENVADTKSKIDMLLLGMQEKFQAGAYIHRLYSVQKSQNIESSENIFHIVAKGHLELKTGGDTIRMMLNERLTARINEVHAGDISKNFIQQMVEARNAEGKTPLLIAIEAGKLETALIFASSLKSPDVIKESLEIINKLLLSVEVKRELRDKLEDAALKSLFDAIQYSEKETAFKLIALIAEEKFHINKPFIEVNLALRPVLHAFATSMINPIKSLNDKEREKLRESTTNDAKAFLSKEKRKQYARDKEEIFKRLLGIGADINMGGIVAADGQEGYKPYTIESTIKGAEKNQIQNLFNAREVILNQDKDGNYIKDNNIRGIDSFNPSYWDEATRETFEVAPYVKKFEAIIAVVNDQAKRELNKEIIPESEKVQFHKIFHKWVNGQRHVERLVTAADKEAELSSMEKGYIADTLMKAIGYRTDKKPKDELQQLVAKAVGNVIAQKSGIELGNTSIEAWKDEMQAAVGRAVKEMASKKQEPQKPLTTPSTSTTKTVVPTLPNADGIKSDFTSYDETTSKYVHDLLKNYQDLLNTPEYELQDQERINIVLSASRLGSAIQRAEDLVATDKGSNPDNGLATAIINSTLDEVKKILKGERVEVGEGQPVKSGSLKIAKDAWLDTPCLDRLMEIAFQENGKIQDIGFTESEEKATAPAKVDGKKPVVRVNCLSLYTRDEEGQHQLPETVKNVSGKFPGIDIAIPINISNGHFVSLYLEATGKGTYNAIFLNSTDNPNGFAMQAVKQQLSTLSPDITIGKFEDLSNKQQTNSYACGYHTYGFLKYCAEKPQGEVAQRTSVTMKAYFPNPRNHLNVEKMGREDVREANQEVLKNADRKEVGKEEKLSLSSSSPDSEISQKSTATKPLKTPSKTLPVTPKRKEKPKTVLKTSERPGLTRKERQQNLNLGNLARTSSGQLKSHIENLSASGQRKLKRTVTLTGLIKLGSPAPVEEFLGSKSQSILELLQTNNYIDANKNINSAIDTDGTTILHRLAKKLGEIEKEIPTAQGDAKATLEKQSESIWLALSHFSEPKKRGVREIVKLPDNTKKRFVNLVDNEGKTFTDYLKEPLVAVNRRMLTEAVTYSPGMKNANKTAAGFAVKDAVTADGGNILHLLVAGLHNMPKGEVGVPRHISTDERYVSERIYEVDTQQRVEGYKKQQHAAFRALEGILSSEHASKFINASDGSNNLTPLLSTLCNTLLTQEEPFCYAIRSGDQKTSFYVLPKIYEAFGLLIRKGANPDKVLEGIIGQWALDKSNNQWREDERFFNRSRNLLVELINNTERLEELGNLATWAIKQNINARNDTGPRYTPGIIIDAGRALEHSKSTREYKAVLDLKESKDLVENAIGDTVPSKRLRELQGDIGQALYIERIGGAIGKGKYGTGGGDGRFYKDKEGGQHLLKSEDIAGAFREYVTPKLGNMVVAAVAKRPLDNVFPNNTLVNIGRANVAVDSPFLPGLELAQERDKNGQFDQLGDFLKVPLAKEQAAYFLVVRDYDFLNGGNRGYINGNLHTAAIDFGKSLMFRPELDDDFQYGNAIEGWTGRVSPPVDVLRRWIDKGAKEGIHADLFMEEGFIKALFDTIGETEALHNRGEIERELNAGVAALKAGLKWDELSQAQKNAHNAILAKEFPGATVDTLAATVKADLLESLKQSKILAHTLQIQMEAKALAGLELNSQGYNEQVTKLADVIKAAESQGIIKAKDKIYWLESPDKPAVAKSVDGYLEGALDNTRNAHLMVKQLELSGTKTATDLEVEKFLVEGLLQEMERLRDLFTEKEREDFNKITGLANEKVRIITKGGSEVPLNVYQALNNQLRVFKTSVSERIQREFEEAKQNNTNAHNLLTLGAERQFSEYEAAIKQAKKNGDVSSESEEENLKIINTLRDKYLKVSGELKVAEPEALQEKVDATNSYKEKSTQIAVVVKEINNQIATLDKAIADAKLAYGKANYENARKELLAFKPNDKIASLGKARDESNLSEDEKTAARNKNIEHRDKFIGLLQWAEPDTSNLQTPKETTQAAAAYKSQAGAIRQTIEGFKKFEAELREKIKAGKDTDQRASMIISSWPEADKKPPRDLNGEPVTAGELLYYIMPGNIKYPERRDMLKELGSPSSLLPHRWYIEARIAELEEIRDQSQQKVVSSDQELELARLKNDLYPLKKRDLESKIAGFHKSGDNNAAKGLESELKKLKASQKELKETINERIAAQLDQLEHEVDAGKKVALGRRLDAYEKLKRNFYDVENPTKNPVVSAETVMGYPIYNVDWKIGTDDKRSYTVNLDRDGKPVVNRLFIEGIAKSFHDEYKFIDTYNKDLPKDHPNKINEETFQASVKASNATLAKTSKEMEGAWKKLVDEAANAGMPVGSDRFNQYMGQVARAANFLPSTDKLGDAAKKYANLRGGYQETVGRFNHETLDVPVKREDGTTPMVKRTYGWENQLKARVAELETLSEAKPAPAYAMTINDLFSVSFQQMGIDPSKKKEVVDVMYESFMVHLKTHGEGKSIEDLTKTGNREKIMAASAYMAIEGTNDVYLGDDGKPAINPIIHHAMTVAMITAKKQMKQTTDGPWGNIDRSFSRYENARQQGDGFMLRAVKEATYIPQAVQAFKEGNVRRGLGFSLAAVTLFPVYPVTVAALAITNKRELRGSTVPTTSIGSVLGWKHVSGALQPKSDLAKLMEKHGISEQGGLAHLDREAVTLLDNIRTSTKFTPSRAWLDERAKGNTKHGDYDSKVDWKQLNKMASSSKPEEKGQTVDNAKFAVEAMQLKETAEKSRVISQNIRNINKTMANDVREVLKDKENSLTEGQIKDGAGGDSKKFEKDVCKLLSNVLIDQERERIFKGIPTKIQDNTTFDAINNAGQDVITDKKVNQAAIDFIKGLSATQQQTIHYRLGLPPLPESSYKVLESYDKLSYEDKKDLLKMVPGYYKLSEKDREQLVDPDPNVTDSEAVKKFREEANGVFKPLFEQLSPAGVAIYMKAFMPREVVKLTAKEEQTVINYMDRLYTYRKTENMFIQPVRDKVEEQLRKWEDGKGKGKEVTQTQQKVSGNGKEETTPSKEPERGGEESSSTFTDKIDLQRKNSSQGIGRGGSGNRPDPRRVSRDTPTGGEDI